MKRILIASSLLLLATASFAQLIPGEGPLVPGNCGFLSMLIPNCGPLVPTAASGGGGGGCNGTVDLSTGCTQPMLGGF